MLNVVVKWDDNRCHVTTGKHQCKQYSMVSCCDYKPVFSSLCILMSY